MGIGSRSAFLLIAWLAAAAPVHAGAFSSRAQVPVDAFATVVGRVLASIPFCGGDADEAAMFKGHINKMLTPFAPDQGDLERFWRAAMAAADAAQPKGVDCTDAGGQALFGDLMAARRDIAAALGVALTQ
jgi:hypothetical protein